MPAPVLIANADYIVIDRSPLILQAGEKVCVGRSDRTWPGWVAVANAEGRTTYVPADLVAMADDGGGVMNDRFDATDLSVRRGDRVVSLQEADGWHWARAADGTEGWVPSYVLDPA